ncbi:MAG: alpha/beta hydrolase, partial [bacterium]|nr:alpha/beta hydrolase [bacterium]
ILMLSTQAHSQNPGEKLEIGTHFTIRSDILDETRNVYIYLPEGYSESGERFDVLYTLYNGSTGFHYSTGVVNQLNNRRMIPKLIVVSVDLGDGRRDLTPTSAVSTYGPTSGGAGNYLKFLKEELIPYIDGKYRTSSERLYYSHSIGGTLGIYSLLSEPGVFTTILASSPWFIYDLEEKYLLKNTEDFFKKRNSQKNFLYISVGNEPRLIPDIEEFISLLEKNKPAGLEWEYEEMSDEDHNSIMARSLTTGLRARYKNR